MEKTVAKKLEALQKLQKIDSHIDNIAKIRGILPQEVEDLEDDIAKFQTRIERQHSELNEIEEANKNKKVAIKDAESLIKKYEDQQEKVRNNREYEAITKEVELQQLEIQILEKKIKEGYQKVEDKKVEIEETQVTLSERENDLKLKQEELENIIKESEEDEQKSAKDRKKATSGIEERLLNSYEKIRKNMRNGLAVVSVKRSACGGCFNIVPPQMHAEIREKKKIVICEHCGRILADVEDEVVEGDKPKRSGYSQKN